jgi:hypothetical protein
MCSERDEVSELNEAGEDLQSVQFGSPAASAATQ